MRGMRAGLVAGLLLALPAGPARTADRPVPRLPQGERVIGSWGIVCVRAPNRRCLASQVVAADPQGRNVVLGITLTADPAARTGPMPRLRLRVGPAIDRAAGFGIKLPGGAELRLPVEACTKTFCEAAGRLTPPIRARFARASMAQVAWRVTGKRQMTAPMNLRGFAEALAAISTPPQTRRLPTA